MNDDFFILDGLIKKTNEPYLYINNRAFLYGDGFFESIYAFNQNIPFLKNHIHRIYRAFTAFGFNEISIFKNLDELKQTILYLARKNKLYKSFRIRISIYRDSGGLFKTNNKNAHFLIQTTKLPFDKLSFNSIGLKLDVFDDIKKQYSSISQFKFIQPSSVIAMNFAIENNLDDIFFLNQNSNIVETSNSNIFIVNNGVLYTPKLTEGCVDGIMRNIIIEIAKELKIEIIESVLSVENLYSAQEILLSNAVSAIRFVAAFKSKRYLNFTAKKLFAKILEKYL